MKQTYYLFLLSLFVVYMFNGCSKKYEIVQKPITFDQERAQLSLEYMKEHYGIEKDQPVIDPKIIVIHWTVIPTADKTFDAFNPSILPSSRDGIRSAGNLNVSSQYMIDRDGTIYQLLPDTVFARHVIGLNYCAIGIENIANGDDLPLTEAQFQANKKLVKQLISKYDIEYLIGHDQYKQFIGHPLWKELDSDYLTDKTDVGPEFIDRLHKELGVPSLKKAPGL